jgi:hypothetical protein
LGILYSDNSSRISFWWYGSNWKYECGWFIVSK